MCLPNNTSAVGNHLQQQQQQQGNNNSTNKKTRIKSEREILIDKLNERVEKLTKKEIERIEGLNKTSSTTNVGTEQQQTQQHEIGIEYKYAQQPMTPLTAGYPIYQLRNQYMVYIYTTFIISTILYCLIVQPISLLVQFICLVSIFLVYDLYSGILHVVFDHPSNIAIPILGQPCLEFQWHHNIPDDIVRKSFIDVCGDLNVVVAIIIAINLYLLPLRTNPIALLLGALKLMMAYYGQYSHKSAHAIGKSLSSYAKFMQQYGLMISHKDHMDHHNPPYSVDFCLIGVCNPIIDFVRKYITTNNTIWLTVFFIWSIVDLYVLTNTITSISTYFGLL